MKPFKIIWHIFLIIYYKLAYNITGITDEEYYLETANQWMDLDNYKRAIINLEKAIKTYDVSNIRYNIAWCYQNLGEYEKACINYEKAYEKKKHIIYLIYIAYCKYCIGNFEESVKIINDIKEEKMDQNVLKEYNRIKNIINNNQLSILTSRSS